MKQTLMTCVAVVLCIGWKAASAEPAQFKDAYQAGKTQQQAGKFGEAREQFKQAMKLATNTQDKVDAQMAIGMTHDGDYSRRYWPAAQKAYIDARVAYAQVLDIPELSPGQRVAAQTAMVNALFAAKLYADARAELAAMMEANDTPPSVKAFARVLTGKSFFYESNFSAARQELAKALVQEGISNTDKAEAQLYIGLSYCHAREYELAKPELQKVLTLPGASAGQLHELRLRKLIPAETNYITVLFIGASQTGQWGVPQIVETLSRSAPIGRPRIIAGYFIRGGTGIQHFWEEGSGPDTARGMVAAVPWDFVVIETHPYLFGHDIFTRYATKFTDLVRGKKATPIFFEAPAFFDKSYPADYQKIHDDTVELARKLNVTVATADYAWMKYLGPTPTPEQRMVLYQPDAVHPSKKGVYMLACSIYAAITGFSPVGLTNAIPMLDNNINYPGRLSETEVQALQEASWQAFQETYPELKSSP